MGNDFYCEQVFSGLIAVDVVAESDSVLAYWHTRPHWPVHIVVASKKHVPSLLECDDTLLLSILSVVRDVASNVVAEHGAARVVTNLGDYQESKHLHWHVGSGEIL